MRIIDALEAAPLGALCTATRPTEALIAPGHAAHGRLNLLWERPAADQERKSLENDFLPPVRLVAIPNVELRADHHAYKDGDLVFMPGIQPNYVRDYCEKGLLAPPLPGEIEEVSEPVFCVTTFTLPTYGHFLLETVPKLMLALHLREIGVAARIAFPSNAGLITEIAKAICPPDSLLLYDSARVSLRLNVSLHPSLLVHYPKQMHDMGVGFVRDLVQRFAPNAPCGDRIFLSRQRWPAGYRTLTNEAELYDVAAAFGFRLVHTQEMAWPYQVRMFAGASHVISAYNSALHGAMFCPAGAAIIALGRVNVLQDGIAASMAHRIGYLAPSSGALSIYDPIAQQPQTYEVSASELRQRLESLSD